MFPLQKIFWKPHNLCEDNYLVILKMFFVMSRTQHEIYHLNKLSAQYVVVKYRYNAVQWLSSAFSSY